MILVAIGNKPLNAAVCGILGINGKRVISAYSMRDLVLCRRALQGVPHELLIEEELCGADLCETLVEVKKDFPSVAITVITSTEYSKSAEEAVRSGLACRSILRPFVVRELENSMGLVV